jgi:5-deoxy-glucuronate isomerase
LGLDSIRGGNVLSDLLVRGRSTPNYDGSLLKIAPTSTNGIFGGFEVYMLNPGQKMMKETGTQEVCIVLLSGKADVVTKRETWMGLGMRMDIFEKIPPFSVYVPNQNYFEINAITRLEVAFCYAPGKGNYSARLITPDDVHIEVVGDDLTEHRIHHLLPKHQPADSLLVRETYTPQGHWSSYPPHKYDQNTYPEEIYLEETYYYRTNPPSGFAVQLVETKDDSLNDALVVRDGDAVRLPKGYHPLSAPPGYETYNLIVMARPMRS